MSVYPGSADLRIYPMSSVTIDTPIYKHDIEHLKGREAYIRDDDDDDDDDDDTEAKKKSASQQSQALKTPQVPAVKKDIHSYSDLLRLYAMFMHFESQVVDSPK